MAFAHEAPAKLAADYAAGKFSSFSAYRTSAGIALETIENAITFKNAHEGIHIGYIMAMRKALAGG